MLVNLPVAQEVQRSDMWYTIIIILLFFAILVSLACGFYFLLTDQKGSGRLLASLTVRITLTVLLMLTILFAWLQGDSSSHGPGFSLTRSLSDLCLKA